MQSECRHGKPESFSFSHHIAHSKRSGTASRALPLCAQSWLCWMEFHFQFTKRCLRWFTQSRHSRSEMMEKGDALKNDQMPSDTTQHTNIWNKTQKLFCRSWTGVRVQVCTCTRPCKRAYLQNWYNCHIICTISVLTFFSPDQTI